MNTSNRYWLYKKYLENARQGNIEDVCHLLLIIKKSEDLNVNYMDNDNQTALHHASSRGHIECVEALLQSPDINVNAISNTGVTPLVIAAVKGHHKVVKMFHQ